MNTNSVANTFRTSDCSTRPDPSTQPVLLPEVSRIADVELKADPHGHLCLQYVAADGKTYALQVPLGHALILTNLLWTTIADLSI